MTEEIKQKLREAGREDLIKVHEINQSGYAGINPNGNIVDRREYTNAIPVQKNELLGIPEPQKIEREFTKQDVAKMINMALDQLEIGSGEREKFINGLIGYYETNPDYVNRTKIINDGK